VTWRSVLRIPSMVGMPGLLALFTGWATFGGVALFFVGLVALANGAGQIKTPLFESDSGLAAPVLGVLLLLVAHLCAWRDERAWWFLLGIGATELAVGTLGQGLAAGLSSGGMVLLVLSLRSTRAFYGVRPRTPAPV
jgi:lysylphosphatidylglycerol synthetase-like protein (DUF2156 family)